MISSAWIFRCHIRIKTAECMTSDENATLELVPDLRQPGWIAAGCGLSRTATAGLVEGAMGMATLSAPWNRVVPLD